jgi:hypothetical protein
LATDVEYSLVGFREGSTGREGHGWSDFIFVEGLQKLR